MFVMAKWIGGIYVSALVALVAMKAVGVLDWSWLQVLAPLWIPLLLLELVIVLLIIAYCGLALMDRDTEN